MMPDIILRRFQITEQADFGFISTQHDSVEADKMNAHRSVIEKVV
jgi:hypothetical protein